MLALHYLAFDQEQAFLVEQNIKKHMRYILKFNPDKEEADRIAQEILFKILENNRHYEDYTSYIKKLARVLGYRKHNEKEVPHDVYGNEGEITNTFSNLKETIDEADMEDRAKLMVALRHLYLKYDKNFPKLALIFTNPELDNADADEIKKLRVREEGLYKDIRNLIETFGVSTLKVLKLFLEDLPNLTNTPVTDSYKELTFKPLNKCDKMIEKLLHVSFETADNKVIPLNPKTMLSEKNPDYLEWKPFKGSQLLQRIDITPFMEYLYDQIYVNEGVETKHIIWCDSSYKMTTPAGDYFIDENRDFFINRCRMELLTAVVKASVGTILAVSPDSIYFKGKPLNFLKTTIKGKVIILPIESQ